MGGLRGSAWPSDATVGASMITNLLKYCSKSPAAKAIDAGVSADRLAILVKAPAMDCSLDDKPRLPEVRDREQVPEQHYSHYWFRGSGSKFCKLWGMLWRAGLSQRQGRKNLNQCRLWPRLLYIRKLALLSGGTCSNWGKASEGAGILSRCS